MGGKKQVNFNTFFEMCKMVQFQKCKKIVWDFLKFAGQGSRP